MTIKSLTERWMNSAAFAPEGSPASGAPATPVGEGASGEAHVGTPSGDGSGGDEFSSFGESDDFDSVELEAGSDPSQAPEVDPAAAVETPAVAPAATPPVAPKAAAEVPPAAAPVPAAPKGPDSPSSAVDELVGNLETNGPALQTWLEQNSFKLTKEEADAFELDAVGQIPKMMAKVQVASMKMTLNMLKNLVPSMIDKQTALVSGKQTKAKEALNEFYTSNSDLNEKDHGALVTKWANAFRAQNPSAPRGDAIKFVANAIRTELGLAAPAAGAAPRVAPFAPARPGARQPTMTKPVENPFSALGMDLDE